MIDFLIGLSYVAMVAMPAIIATVGFNNYHKGDI
jgi:hypothetical protein